MDSVMILGPSGKPAGRRWKVNDPERGIHIEVSAVRETADRLQVKLHTKAAGVPGEWFDVGYVLTSTGDSSQFNIESLDGDPLHVGQSSEPGGITINILQGRKKK
jgi:hypothetical protein